MPFFDILFDINDIAVFAVIKQFPEVVTERKYDKDSFDIIERMCTEVLMKNMNMILNNCLEEYANVRDILEPEEINSLYKATFDGRNADE